jgi:excisionase family DNA binding protein
MERMIADKSETRQELSTVEASKLSGLSKNQITHLLRNGKLEGRRFGQRLWIVYADSLEHYLATPHKSGPKGPRKNPKQEPTDVTATDTHDSNHCET